MAYFETIKDGVKYVEVDGILRGVFYEESKGVSGAHFCKFSVGYDTEQDDFGNYKTKYLSDIVAWGDWAELVNYLSEEGELFVNVKCKVTEYKGKEQYRCTWVQSAQKPKARKRGENDFPDIDI